MQHELEQERKYLVKLRDQALDDGNEMLADELCDELSVIAKIMNSGLTKLQYYEAQNYARELNVIPSEIEDEVLAAMKNHNLTKEMVDTWNPYLDFDLHSKLERYGYIGSARLYKIFIKGN
tara:strand:+ start:117 stop:479 length:363 start_codon:yes stop_codon:yes gene_type:complete